MMTSLAKGRLFAKFYGNAPVDDADIQRFEAVSSFNLPNDYAQFLQQANGGEGFIGPSAYVIFWRLEELSDMNKAYQVDEYAPGLFLFGSNGGGEAFAFDTRSPTRPVVSVPFVGMELNLACSIAPNFGGFLEELFRS